jgi:hypothetical protein
VSSAPAAAAPLAEACAAQAALASTQPAAVSSCARAASSAHVHSSRPEPSTCGTLRALMPATISGNTRPPDAASTSTQAAASVRRQGLTWATVWAR